jgi:hypothetical protein
MIEQGFLITGVSAGVSATLTPRHSATPQSVTTIVVNTALAGTGPWIEGKQVLVRLQAQ